MEVKLQPQDALNGPELTDRQLDEVAFRVVEQLQGMTVGQALHVLKDIAPRLLGHTHLVEVTSQRFRSMQDLDRAVTDEAKHDPDWREKAQSAIGGFNADEMQEPPPVARAG